MKTVRGVVVLMLGLAILWALEAPRAIPQEPQALVVVDATAPPPALDPFKVYGTQAQSLFRLVFAPLFDRDPDGKIVTPLLERWRQLDPVTWEFHLRPGIRFHDGRELTAADVVFSLKRIVDPDAGSVRRTEFAELQAVVALDPFTVQVRTHRPYALLPARLTQFSMILPDGLRGRPEQDFFRAPVGLGPFRLAQFTKDQVTLESFPEYFGGPPRVARAIYRFVMDPAERMQLLSERQADLLTNLPPQQVDVITRTRHLRLVKRHSIRFMDVMLDTARGPLREVDVRRALRYGTDVDSLIKYVARGNGRPLAGLTLPEDFGFHPDLRPYPFEPARAKALLAQAGYAAGLRLQGLATHDTRTLATALSQQWSKIGVTLDLTVEGRAPAMARWIRERDRHDFLVLDPTSIMFDAAFHLRLHHDPAHPMARSAQPRAVELLNLADAERDPERRAALLREAQEIVHEQALAIPLYQVVDLYGVRDRVRGFVPSADTILRLAGVGLAP